MIPFGNFNYFGVPRPTSLSPVGPVGFPRPVAGVPGGPRDGGQGDLVVSRPFDPGPQRPMPWAPAGYFGGGFGGQAGGLPLNALGRQFPQQPWRPMY